MSMLKTSALETYETDCEKNDLEEGKKLRWVANGENKNPSTLWFLFLLLILISSRVLGRTHQSLWFDEGFTVALASAPSFHDFWLRFGHFTTSEHLQPLYYILIFLWSRVAGTSDGALRLLSSLFSIGSGLAAYRAVSILSRHRKHIALLALAAVTISSYSLYYGQEARPYALLQMVSFMLLAAWLHSRASIDDPATTSISRVILAVTCSLCFLASAFTALLVLCLSFSDLVVTKDFKRWFQRWQIAIALSVSTYLVYLLPSLLTMPSFIAHDITGIHQPLWMNVGYSIYGIVFGTTLPPAVTLLRGANKLRIALSFWPIILLAFLTLISLIVAAGLVLRKSKKMTSDISTLLLSLFVYIFVFYGFFGGIGHLNVLPRHSAALFALLFITVAGCGSQVLLSTSRSASVLLKCGIAGYFILNGFSLYGYYRDPAFQKDDYRNAAKTINQSQAPVFIVAGDPMLLARYGAQSNDATMVDPKELSGFIQRKSGHASNVLLVFNSYRSFRWGAEESVPQAMYPEYTCRVTQTLAYFEIYSCDREVLPSQADSTLTR